MIMVIYVLSFWENTEVLSTSSCAMLYPPQQGIKIKFIHILISIYYFFFLKDYNRPTAYKVVSYLVQICISQYQTAWSASWETYMQVRKQQLELDMEQQTGSKEEKEYIKAVYCHPAYLTSMQSTSWETLGWKKRKLESRLLGGISITSDMQMTPPLWQKVKN